jgi:hypothetical protein
MDSLAEKFNRIFKPYGGRFPDHLLSLQLNYWLREMRILLNLLQTNISRPITVYIDLINNPELNACVTKEEDVYFIGVNAGGLYVISDIFLRMLSSPDVLAVYGDISSEVTRKIPNAQITNYYTLYLADNTDTATMPLDITRANVAKVLATFCVNHLVSHEFGHIVLGHIDHLIFKQPEKLYWERSVGDPVPHISPLFQQSKELDADAYAINMDIQIVGNNILNSNSVDEKTRHFLKELSTRVFMWNYAVYTFWRLYGSRTYDYGDLSTMSHPPPALRQHGAMGLLQTIVKHNFPDSGLMETLSKLLQDSVMEVEKAFAAISEQPVDIRAYAFVFHEKMEEHYQRLKAIHPAVIEMLAPYAFFRFGAAN